MITRTVTWHIIKNMYPLYGIQVLDNGDWMYVKDSNGLCLYETAAERDAARKAIQSKDRTAITFVRSINVSKQHDAS